MKKYMPEILLAVAVIITLALAIAGTIGSIAQQTKETTGPWNGYGTVEGKFGIYDIIYDTRTGVMYHISRGSHNQGTLTLLVNADGTPRVWEGWEE